MKTLRDIYNYRQIVTRCESGGELSIGEIQILSATETARQKVTARAMLRGPRVADWVEVAELGPAGVVCRACPWMEEGQAYEIVFDDEVNQDSFRFKAIVHWTRDAGDDLDVCLRFTGSGLHVRRGHRGIEPTHSLLTRFAA